MITPTNGRQVWFTPNTASAGAIAYCGQPLAATVVRVWTDRMVNLVVLDADGKAHALTSVTLLQDDDIAPAHGYYAEWMPYQKGQAAKASDSALPHVERMKLEQVELAERLGRLGTFVRSSGFEDDTPTAFEQLPPLEQQLMVDQYHAMQNYLKALSARIALAR